MADEQTVWMGTPNTAEYLGITLRTLYRLIDDGQLPAYRFGRVYRVKRGDVEAFIERHRVVPGSLAHLVGDHSAPAGPVGDLIAADLQDVESNATSEID